MKKNHSFPDSKRILFFWARLLIYYLFLLLPKIHPAMAVYGDTPSLWGLFILTPLFALLAFYRPPYPGKIRFFWQILFFVISLFVMGWNSTSMGFYILALWAWISTSLVFHRDLKSLLFPEPLYFVWVLMKLLGFSHSSTAMADQTSSISTLVVIFLAFGFFLYLLGIGLLSQQKLKWSIPWKEAILLFLIAIPLALILFQFAPNAPLDDLRRNDLLNERQPRSRNDRGDQQEEGDLQGSELEEEGGGNELLSVSEEEWAQGMTGQTGGKPRQYMVMVVQSPQPLVYMADGYHSLHDSVMGFQTDHESPLNQIYNQRYLETWKNDDPTHLTLRSPLWLRVYSTLVRPAIPYYPFMLEPTVRDNRYAPLSYSYRNLSFPSQLIPGGRDISSADLEEEQKEELAPFLEVNLSDEVLLAYQSYLQDHVDLESPPDDRVRDILESFRTCQYNIGFSDDMSTEVLQRFLFEVKEGDCSEFSHSAALLGRLAGIPSRVVTGYIVSRDLQTPAHQMGLEQLQLQHPGLAEEQLNELYLVTTAHRHSWTQFYFSRYGWVDYETTSTAIPPAPGGDLSQADVVIPRLYEQKEDSFLINLPWGFLARLILYFGLLLLFFRFCLRRWSLLRLMGLSKGYDETALKALYSLAINRYNGRQKHPKNPALTPAEMTALWPALKEFADLYTPSLLNPNLTEEQFRENLDRLRELYLELMKTTDLQSRLRGWFSLREVQ